MYATTIRNNVSNRTSTHSMNNSETVNLYVNESSLVINIVDSILIKFRNPQL